jgi:hypothetical protein
VEGVISDGHSYSDFVEDLAADVPRGGPRFAVSGRMGKTNSTKKLSLKKTTLRNLSEKEASNVAGGKGILSIPASGCYSKIESMCPTKGATCAVDCTSLCTLKAQ